MIPPHVGNRAGRRPIHVADHHLFGRRSSVSFSKDSGRCSASACCPQELIKKVSELAERNQVNPKVIEALEKNSPLGRVLAAALANRHRGREIMMERVEDAGRHVVHELERFVNSLGTIASISPLLGLLGTVTGIIRAFNAVMLGGMGDPRMLAGGISEALVCTAAGLTVAIPPTFIAPLPARQGRAHRRRDGKDRGEFRRLPGCRHADRGQRRRRRAQRMKMQSRKGKEDPEINLISLIDVSLLLVIFFMLSSTFMQEVRLKIELPQASLAPTGKQKTDPHGGRGHARRQLSRQRPRADQLVARHVARGHSRSRGRRPRQAGHGARRRRAPRTSPS